MSEIKYGGHTAADLAKLESAATPREWHSAGSALRDENDRDLDETEWDWLSGDEKEIPTRTLDQIENDYHLAATARNALPDLLARIEQLEEQLRTLIHVK